MDPRASRTDAGPPLGGLDSVSRRPASVVSELRLLRAIDELEGQLREVGDIHRAVRLAQRDLMQRWAQGPAGQKLGQGSGLGLSIVARYAELLGAELRLDAAEPSGLRVSVTFAQLHHLPLQDGYGNAPGPGAASGPAS